MDVVNSQILLYEIDHDQTPSSISQLIEGGYLNESQATCPNGKSVTIIDGDAYAK